MAGYNATSVPGAHQQIQQATWSSSCQLRKVAPSPVACRGADILLTYRVLATESLVVRALQSRTLCIHSEAPLLAGGPSCPNLRHHHASVSSAAMAQRWQRACGQWLVRRVRFLASCQGGYQAFVGRGRAQGGNNGMLDSHCGRLTLN